MRISRYIYLVLGLFVLNTVFGFAQEQDTEGSRDHPLISRYPGSVITSYDQKEFDEYELPLGPVLTEKGEKVLKKMQRLEGKVTTISYNNPQGRSVLEMFRNYEMALRRAGFEMLFTCKDVACGRSYIEPYRGLGYFGGDYGQQYLATKLARPEGEVYVALQVDPAYKKTFLTVVELKPMEAGLVTVNAEALAGDIERAGHVAVYGIYFDTGKAEVKPESEPTLKEIAKLLQDNPKLKLHVVGHTDSVGELEMNMDLSRRRAKAVVEVLTTKYSVAAARLQADGVGPLSPVASNKTEEGRAKNRRVELVEE